jgi:hypothetical protein
MRLPQGSRTKILQKIASEVVKLRRLFSSRFFQFLLRQFLVLAFAKEEKFLTSPARAGRFGMTGWFVSKSRYRVFT